MDEAVAKHKELKKTPITTQPITHSVKRSVEKSVEKSASSSESLEYSEIYLFTDGSCLGNPGPGGYGALIQYKVHHPIFKLSFRIVGKLYAKKRFLEVKLTQQTIEWKLAQL